MKKRNYIIIAIIILALIGGLVFYLINKENKETDAEQFALEYTEVGEDNVFIYKTAEEVIKLMQHGTGVVYLGFPECPWCQAYVKYLNEVAKEVGIDKIYYYNILEDRKNNTDEYQKIVALLKENLEYDNEGNPRIYVPNVSFHVEGKIIGNDLETAYDTKGYEKPEEYWTEEEVKDLKEKLTTYMEEVYTKSNMCTTCNK